MAMIVNVKRLASFLFGTAEPPPVFEAPEHVHLRRNRRNTGSS
jgi:hypothetical protein